MKRAWMIGLALWAIGTVGIRLAGQYVLRPGHTAASVTLYAISFILMAWLVPNLCRGGEADKSSKPRHNGMQFHALCIIILPTLLLDAFATLFFPTVYPNVAAGAAPIFGGWMLICCGGAVAGLLARR
jgi:hypothetical protein